MKETEAQKKATRNYIAKQYRPSVYIDKDKQEQIENHFKSKGYKSFNEYIIALINADMAGNKNEQKQKQKNDCIANDQC